jgi:hypothetical protein
MSDPSSTAPEAEPAKIDFERAEFAEPAADHLACGLCKRAIGAAYFQYLGKILCDACREGVQRGIADARRGATLGKAILLGGGAALACGIGYAIFVGVTKVHFALVTIAIGWAVGRVIQKVTRGFGGVRHQVLAVALTYFATSMGYLPAIFEGLREAGHATEQTVPGAPGTAAAPAPAPAPAPTPAGADDAKERPGLLVSLAFLTAITTALTLAAPFLDLSSGFSGILGLLIIFFGLRTAWRVSKGIDAPITGPHALAPAGS